MIETIGFPVTANQSSAGNYLPIDSDTLAGCTVTNSSAYAVEYSTGGAWTTIAAGGSSTINTGAIATTSLRFRKKTGDSIPVVLSVAVTHPGITPAQLATDAGGKTVDVLSSGSASVRLRTGQHLDNRAFHRLGKPIAANIQSGSGVTVSGQSGNTPTLEYVQRDGMMGIKITTVAGFFGEVNLPVFSDTVANGIAHALIYVEDVTKTKSTTLYLGDAGYANFFSMLQSLDTNATCQKNGYHVLSPEAANVTASATAKWSVGGGSPSFGTTTFANAKIRITPEAGQQAVATVFGMWINGSSSRPRITISADDGWATQYTDMLPILEKYNLRCSFGIIGDLVGTAGYMTLNQLKDLVARGHECVVHGPLGGTGSLQNYSTYADVLRDVSYHRDFLVSNSLAKNGSEKIYVFPQGKYALSRGDQTILQALNDAGFVGGRLADETASVMPSGPLFKRNAMLCNILGHNYAGGTEAANISNIINRVQTAADAGKNSVLMFHKFSSGVPGDSTTIQNSNFDSICAAINELENAGTAQNALLSELIYESLAM